MGPRGIWSNECGAGVVEHAILSCAVGLVIASAVATGLSPREMLARVVLITETLIACEQEAGGRCDLNEAE